VGPHDLVCSPGHTHVWQPYTGQEYMAMTAERLALAALLLLCAHIAQLSGENARLVSARQLSVADAAACEAPSWDPGAPLPHSFRPGTKDHYRSAVFTLWTLLDQNIEIAPFHSRPMTPCTNN
jgi:hypothetical protein